MTRRIRAAVRPGPAAFAEDCSLLLLMPEAKEAAGALEGLRRGGLRMSLYAVSTPALVLEYLRGLDGARHRRRLSLPLAVIVDASPLAPGARKLVAELRGDPRLKYLPVVLLDKEAQPEVDGVSLTLHVAKPRASEGYEALASRLAALLPAAQ